MLFNAAIVRLENANFPQATVRLTTGDAWWKAEYQAEVDAGHALAEYATTPHDATDVAAQSTIAIADRLSGSTEDRMQWAARYVARAASLHAMGDLDVVGLRLEAIEKEAIVASLLADARRHGVTVPGAMLDSPEGGWLSSAPATRADPNRIYRDLLPVRVDLIRDSSEL
jgi:hypothetical protein